MPLLPGRLSLRFSLALLIAVATARAALPVHAQEPGPGEPRGEVAIGAGLDLTVSSLQARAKKLQSTDAAIDDATAEALRAYSSAVDQLEVAAEWKRRSDALSRLQREGPRLLEGIQRDLATWAKQAPAALSPQLSRGDLEGLLAETEARLSVVRKGLLELDAEQAQISERRLTLPVELAAVGAAREGLLAEIGLPPLPKGSVESTLAQRALALATQKAGAEQSLALELELSTYEIRRQLLAARRDLLKRKAEVYSAGVSDLQAGLAERREREAESAAAAAKADQASLARVHPVLGRLAEENAALTGERTGPEGLGAKIDATARALSATAEQLQRLEERSKGVRQKVAAAGLTDAIGLLLRKERGELADVERARAGRRARRDEIAAVQLKSLTLEDQLRALPTLETEVEGILKAQGEGLAPAEKSRVESSARNVLKSRRASLEALIRDCNAYFASLVDLDAREVDLVRVVDDYRAFLDQHVLWIPNASVPSLREAGKWRDAAFWLVDPRNFARSGARLVSTARAEPLATAAGLLLLATFAVYRRRLKKSHDTICAVRRVEAAPEVPAAAAATALGVLLALPGPFAARFLSWMLAAGGASPDDFSHALAGALAGVAFPLLVAEFLRRAARKDGPAFAFLEWPRPALESLRRQVVLAETVALPAFFVSGLFDLQAEDDWSETLGRAAFCLGVGVVALGLQRLFSPTGPLAQQTVRRADLQWAGPLLARAARLPLLVAVVVIAIALSGYYYTASVLVERLWRSGLAALALLVAHAAVLRSLTASEQASRAAATNSESGDDEASSVEASPSGAATATEVPANTRGLVRLLAGLALAAVLFSVWVDVFPALRFFEKIELWDAGTVVDRVIGTGEAAHVESVRVKAPVTLANLSIALLGVALAIVGARNLPTVLELALLSRLRLDHGLRYAISTVTRYAVFVIGAVVALKNLGVQWQSVQWLVAAISVGLGFGLQEIFGNFVSGLIVLFERPVRVGDMVTIDGVSGVVERIEMRATTVVDLDRKELIVPNKQLITGKLVNWSLADTTVRLVVPVGVAYGSDTATVTRILQDIAKQSPTVLEMPSPLVFFQRFGDSALEFELRVFLAHPDHLGSTRHEILCEIDRRFRASGIEIPFPQRDLHLRSIDAAAAGMLAARRGEAGDPS
jgi:potassium efflux system protein